MHEEECKSKCKTVANILVFLLSRRITSKLTESYTICCSTFESLTSRV